MPDGGLGGVLNQRRRPSGGLGSMIGQMGGQARLPSRSMGSPAGGASQGHGSFGFGGMMGGQSNPMQNAGSRNVGSVNWDAVGGIQNYLGQLAPAQQQQASQWLTSQGMMPSVNGSPMFGGGPAQQQWTNFGSSNPARVKSPYEAEGTPAAGYSNPAFGSWTPGAGSAGGAPGMGGMGGMGPNMGGGSGTIGLPLEGSAQNAIQGILDNPSPFSQGQQAQMRNRALSGNSQAMATQLQRAREDAARRGLNPGEAAGNLSAIESRFDRQGQQQGLDFDLANAQATRGGLMQGLGAAQGMMGLQLGNEDSIRRYLAMLQGQTPMFMGV